MIQLSLPAHPLLRAPLTPFSLVQDIPGATNDSGLLVHISQISAAKARAMKSGSGAFDVDDFVARLITYMGGRKPFSPAVGDDDGDDDDDYDEGGAPLDWERIGRRALAKSRRVPAMDFMCVVSDLPQRGVVQKVDVDLGSGANVECDSDTDGDWCGRLGPLSIEQKKRAQAKRAKLEKNKEDLKKPQEITEEDITRSKNETTTNVATVCPVSRLSAAGCG